MRKSSPQAGEGKKRKKRLLGSQLFFLSHYFLFILLARGIVVEETGERKGEGRKGKVPGFMSLFSHPFRLGA